MAEYAREHVSEVNAAANLNCATLPASNLRSSLPHFLDSAECKRIISQQIKSILSDKSYQYDAEQTLVHLALVLRNLGDLAGAKKTLDSILLKRDIAADGRELAAPNLVALGYAELGDFDSAFEIAKALQSGNRVEFLSAIFCKEILETKGDARKDALRRAFRQAKDFAFQGLIKEESTILISVGQALLKLQDIDGAISCLKSMRDYSLQAKFAVSLAFALTKKGRLEEAILAVAGQRNHYDAIKIVKQLLKIYSSSKGIEETKKEIDRISRLKCFKSVITLPIMAACMIEVGEVKTARSFFNHAFRLILRSDAPISRGELAILQAFAGDVQGAESTAQKIYSDNPVIAEFRKRVLGVTDNPAMYRRAVRGIAFTEYGRGKYLEAANILLRGKLSNQITREQKLKLKDSSNIDLARTTVHELSGATAFGISELLDLFSKPGEPSEFGKYNYVEIDGESEVESLQTLLEQAANLLPDQYRQIIKELQLKSERAIKLDKAKDLAHLYLKVLTSKKRNHVDDKLWLSIACFAGLEELKLALEYLAQNNQTLLRVQMRREFSKFGSCASEITRKWVISEIEEDLKYHMRERVPGQKLQVACLCENIFEIDTKEGYDLLLQIGRAEFDKLLEFSDYKNPALKIILNHLALANTLKANDLVLSFITSGRLSVPFARELLLELIDNNYLDRSIRSWLKPERESLRFGDRVRSRDESFLVTQIIIKLLQRGIMPSHDILIYLTLDHTDKSSKKFESFTSEPVFTDEFELIFEADDQHSSSMSTEDESYRPRVDDRQLELVGKSLDELKSFELDFERFHDVQGLVQFLATDQRRALAYYCLNNGKTKFSLINNYSFVKFFELLKIANDLRYDPEPMSIFEMSLQRAKFDATAIADIRKNLRHGSHPFRAQAEPILSRLIRLDICDTQKLEMANLEAGQVIGRNQLGTCLRTPFYRSYLLEEVERGANASKESKLLLALNQATTLSERTAVLANIEKIHADYILRIARDLEKPWKKLNDKLVFGTSIENILNNDTNPIECESLIANIEMARLLLKRAKQEHILTLKGENPKIKAINLQIRRKERALDKLNQGLAKKPELQTRIEEIAASIETLKEQRTALSLNFVSERYAEYSPEERKKLIESEVTQLRKLVDKNPAAIFVCLLLETVGEDRITESDAELIKEVASHLEHPLQLVSDLSKLDSSGRREKQEKKVRLRYLDKREDLMTMVRFADSKICCFSTNNYNTSVAHGTKNKYWLASILSDPLSFVFEVEQANEVDQNSGPVQNLGFVFGMFGVSQQGLPAVFLNGVYLSTGNDTTSAISVLNAIENMLSRRIGASFQFSAAIHGGTLGDELDQYVFVHELIATRLRALKDHYGMPCRKVYDDMGTVINHTTNYRGYLKKLSP